MKNVFSFVQAYAESLQNRCNRCKIVLLTLYSYMQNVRRIVAKLPEIVENSPKIFEKIVKNHRKIVEESFFFSDAATCDESASSFVVVVRQLLNKLTIRKWVGG